MCLKNITPYIRFKYSSSFSTAYGLHTVQSAWKRQSSIKATSFSGPRPDLLHEGNEVHKGGMVT